jgi:peptidoglycan/LPS O-acetylase OafA/YrhL
VSTGEAINIALFFVLPSIVGLVILVLAVRQPFRVRPVWAKIALWLLAIVTALIVVVGTMANYEMAFRYTWPTLLWDFLIGIDAVVVGVVEWLVRRPRTQVSKA